jgi:serine/threonine protein kinase
VARQYEGWTVIRSLNEGGQGHIFLVEDTTGKYSGHYVLKRLKNRGRLDLFEREVKAMQAVDHPHVLRVIEANIGSTSPYYVAEYCEGGSLAQQPERFCGDIDGTTTVLTWIAEALQAAHDAKVIHRDVKPANILFRKDGTPVLGDFGICHMDGDRRVTVVDEAMGSLNYIAPEMESGRRFGDPTDRTDVYALGKVAYWMLSGGREFAREDHRASALYLPRLFGDELWEHVHALLDETVVEDPQRRLPIDRLLSRLQQTASLITGRYTPLRPSMGLRCRFCGIGVYTKYATKQNWPPQAGWFSAVGRFSGADLRVLRCNHCGHVEWFDMMGIDGGQWWEK